MNQFTAAIRLLEDIRRQHQDPTTGYHRAADALSPCSSDSGQCTWCERATEALPGLLAAERASDRSTFARGMHPLLVERHALEAVQEALDAVVDLVKELKRQLRESYDKTLDRSLREP
jgi:hypothetical protein